MIFFLKAGKNALIQGLLKSPLVEMAISNEINRQEKVYKGCSDVGKTSEEVEAWFNYETLEYEGTYNNKKGDFKPDTKLAVRHAEQQIKMSVGMRLEGAITLYERNNQMECLRYIILALDSVFNILKWHEASRWCNEQNRVLYKPDAEVLKLE